MGTLRHEPPPQEVKAVVQEASSDGATLLGLLRGSQANINAKRGADEGAAILRKLQAPLKQEKPSAKNGSMWWNDQDTTWSQGSDAWWSKDAKKGGKWWSSSDGEQ